MTRAAGGEEAREVVTLHGVAENAKGGAVLVSDEHGVVYVQGMHAWDDAVRGKRVTATGTLRTTKMIPDPVVDETGAISQGAYGDQTVFQVDRWTLDE